MVITSKFNSYCNNCRGTIRAGEKVVWNRGEKGVWHADVASCRAERAKSAAFVPAPTGVTVTAQPIVNFLTAARERGLQFPKVQFVTSGNRTIALSLAGRGSKYPGAVQVKVNGEWIGRVEASGNVAGPLSRDAEMVETLRTIAADPATAARTFGQVTGRCSFCAKELTDAGSIEVGYGPVCARNYGLPHKAQGTRKIVALPDTDGPLFPADAVGESEQEPADDNPIDETAYDADPEQDGFAYITRVDPMQLVREAAEQFLAGRINADELRDVVNANAITL